MSPLKFQISVLTELNNSYHCVGIQNFNPVTIRILNKCQAFHFTIVRFLHKFDSQFFKSFTSTMNIGNSNSNVTLGKTAPKTRQRERRKNYNRVSMGHKWLPKLVNFKTQGICMEWFPFSFLFHLHSSLPSSFHSFVSANLVCRSPWISF